MKIDADPGTGGEGAAGEQQPARLEVVEAAPRDVIEQVEIDDHVEHRHGHDLQSEAGE